MRLRWWRTLLAGAVASVALLGSAAPALAGPCYVVTVYDTSGNPRQIEVCPYD